jgi:hypothetical protein
MKVLLDECVTCKLRRDFRGHEVYTVEEAGFKGLKNGDLLREASGKFDVLITVDQKLRYQQNIKSLKIAVLVFAVRRNTYEELHPLMDHALDALKHIKSGEFVIIKSI